MNIDRMISLLEKARDEWGNVPVMLRDPMTGNSIPVQTLIKLHPYTGPNGCMNRKAPVDSLMIVSGDKESPDLVIGL